jgi:16S rRNA A1518/A1519 N6-dimethyltransferase RsmA/KsgA/DIM1 with predicted DNA glycosylase/AP lyase activity
MKIIIGNALKVDFEDWTGEWIVGNIPYHITEPLFNKLIKTKIEGSVFLVGDAFAKEINEKEDSEKYGKLSMMIETFFKTSILKWIGKDNFEPAPKTESAIIKLIPRNEGDFKNKKLFLKKHLFMTAKSSGKLKSKLREGLIRFEGGKMTKNEARSIIDKMGIPEEILEKPFEQLSNKWYRELNLAINRSN